MPQKILCEPCGVFFTNEKFYKKHVQSGHQNAAPPPKKVVPKKIKEHPCTMCDKIFTSSYNLKYHTAHHINAREHVCSMCPKAYNTASDLAQHFKSHEKGVPQECIDCGLVFQEKKQLDLHVKEQHQKPKVKKQRTYKKNEESKECNLCGVMVKSLRKHYFNVHMNIQEHECHFCYKKFNKSSGLKRHIQNVHTQVRNCVCDICGSSFCDKSTLQRHRNTHGSAQVPYYCPICRKPIKDVKEHYETLHMDRQHGCKFCFRRFRQKRELNVHIATKHTQIKKWLCDECGKGFGDQSSLNRHRLLHSNQKLVYCTFCKKFVESIKDHYESFHMDLQFGCEHCHRRFRKNRECQNHVISKHTDIKKWLCDLCGKDFGVKVSLRRHIERHDSVIGEYVCDMCGLVYHNRASIRNHLRTHKEASESDESDDRAASVEENWNFDYGKADSDDSDYFKPLTKPTEPKDDKNCITFIDIKKEPMDEMSTFEYSPIQSQIKNEKSFDVDFFDTKQEESEHDDNFEDNYDSRDVESEEEPVKKDTIEENLKINCSFCKSLTFKSKEDFRQHFMNVHIKKNRYAFGCSKCDKTFRDKKALENHMQIIHRKVDCKYCKETFDSEAELRKHSKSHHNIIKDPGSGLDFYCALCKKRFTLQSDLYRHHEDEHDSGKHFKCETCPEKFLTLNDLRLHKEFKHNIYRRTRSKNHMCLLCGLSFPNGSNLVSHRRRVHNVTNPEDVYECEICKEVLKNIYWKQKHYAQVHLNGKKLKRVCGHCKTEFDLYEDFKAHIESHSGIFICITCGDFRFDAESLKSHEKAHRGIDANMRKHICDHCGNRTFTKYQLEIHMLMHMKDCNIHYCDICGKGFRFASSLYTHRKYHAEGEFVCTYCGKKFVRKTDLISHNRIHTNEKPFKCQICDRGFSFKQLLQYHQQTHPETRVMFKCKKCENQFIDRKQLTIHEDQAHPELRPFRCFICDTSFKHEHNLRKHNAHKHL